MFKTYLKPILKFNRAQNKAPNFLLVYLIIWLLWHSQFFITLVSASGTISNKFSAALAATEHQYIVVFMLTGLFFIGRLAWLYFSHHADRMIEEDEPIVQKIGSDQLFAENKDVLRLLDLLEQTKKSLAKVKESEAQAQKEKSEALAKVFAIQKELEEVQADLAIMTKENQTLAAKLNQNLSVL